MVEYSDIARGTTSSFREEDNGEACSAYGCIRDVCHDGCGSIQFGVSQECGISQSIFDLVESGDSLITPFQSCGSVLGMGEELIEGLDDGSAGWQLPAVKVH